MIKINRKFKAMVAMVVTVIIAKAQSSDGLEGKVLENIGKARGKIVHRIAIKSQVSFQIVIILGEVE